MKLFQTLKSLFLSLGQRLLFGLLTLAFILFLSFMGLDMARGVPLENAATEAVRKSVNYVGKAVQGDFGETTAGGFSLLPTPVIELIPDIIVRSFGLLAVSLLLSALLGFILGLLSAGKRSGRSLFAIILSIIGISVPSFFAAMLLQVGVTKISQATGEIFLPVGGFGWDKHLILPALVLAARPLAQISRVTFVTIEEILLQDYVRTAHSKGLRQRAVTAVHVFRNAAISILTTIGLSLRFSLSSLPVVEFFFGWAGIGFTLLKAISQRDDNLTVILALTLGALVILVNIFLDLLYHLIDPRLADLARNISREKKKGIFQQIKAFKEGFKRNKKEKEEKDTQSGSPFTALVKSKLEAASPEQRSDRNKGRRRAWLQGTFGNFPFMLGAMIVLGLFLVIIFGPQLSPHSPYTTQGLTIEDGVFSVPPFEPDEVYPWGTDMLGRDIMSLVLSGAQQTIFLAISVVLARIMVGFILGAIAGWLNGSRIDRFIVGLAEIIAAFPTLLLAMILVLAFGIRRGLDPFVIALGFVGWGEIMQYVRSEVMVIRPKLFIESAVALGARSPRIIWRHVLPNLIPSLVSIIVLEMGAVLMLLGELGFIGIFIGGGAFADLDIAGAPFHYSDVPEWGAMLSNVRTYARSYPWMAIYPAGAFFIAIMGFNLFGEGIRRLIERVGVEVTRVFANQYTLIGSTLAVAAFFWLRGSTGDIVFYQQQARLFNGEQALGHVAYLTDPDLDGRALGSEGINDAADYIASEFEAMGIQPAGEKSTYFQTRSRSYEELDSIPLFDVDDGKPAPIYREDFVEYAASYFRNFGEAESKIRFIAAGELLNLGTWFGPNIPALRDLDYSDEILLVLSEEAANDFLSVPKAGLLVVTDDEQKLQRRFTLSSRNPFSTTFGTNREEGSDTPIMWISQEMANRLLSGSGYDVTDLTHLSEELGQDEVIGIKLDTNIHMKIEGSLQEKVEARHVIGYLPGAAAVPGETQLDDKMIVVLAQYDQPPLLPDGQVPAGANDNAAGVAVMLELIRTIQESGYQPYKTFLFVAYSGEGLEGGENVQADVDKFLSAKTGFSSAYEVETIVDLRGLGAKEGNQLLLSVGGSLRLANIFESAAKRMGTPTKRTGERVDISIVFADRAVLSGGEAAPRIGLLWEGWDENSDTILDSYEKVSAENLDQSGESISLALMMLGRETQH
ncbi:MAG: ABC transporter permease subunit [Chloroflexi bacterium]|nr:ABC transporter permease subunit [Chloroflexota bacterium]